MPAKLLLFFFSNHNKTRREEILALVKDEDNTQFKGAEMKNNLAKHSQ